MEERQKVVYGRHAVYVRRPKKRIRLAKEITPLLMGT